MRALVLEREGRKAVLLLPGGEMRTVRAPKGWETGMEVSVRPYPLRRKKKKFNLRAALYPLAACAAALLIMAVGLNRLGGGHIDRQHPVQPLSSGHPLTGAAGTSEPTAAIAATPMPTPERAMNTPDMQPTPMPKTAASPVQTVQPTPIPDKICDERGGTGHDDDDCPNEICDECGGIGHDDDHCPNEICDECGQTGHDDDDCPQKRRSR